MTTPESDTLQTTAWYYKRQLFSSGSPGVLSLADGRLNFVITKNNEIAFDVPLALRQAQGQVKDADRTCTTQVTYHWIRVAMSVTYNDRRHLVSFVGDRSASQAADASRLVTGLLTLREWRHVIEAVANGDGIERESATELE